MLNFLQNQSIISIFAILIGLIQIIIGVVDMISNKSNKQKNIASRGSFINSGINNSDVYINNSKKINTYKNICWPKIIIISGIITLIYGAKCI